MTVDESNQPQAELWTTTGPMWVALRERFDAQSGHHGRAAIEALDARPGDHVIDIGCGAGSTAIALARLVGDAGTVLGLDISPTMVEGARAHTSELGIDNVTFRVGDAMVEEFDGTADRVYSRFGVMFFSDATAGFANIRTALRPGGRMAFACWQSPLANPWIAESFAVASRYLELPFGSEPTAPGPFSLADPDRVRTVLSDAGFQEVELSSFEAPSILGPDSASAADFMMKLLPGGSIFLAEQPDDAAKLAIDLAATYEQWRGPDGIASPSAAWIVSATKP